MECVLWRRGLLLGPDRAQRTPHQRSAETDVKDGECAQQRSEFTIQSRFLFTTQTFVLLLNARRHSSYYREKKQKKNKTLFRCFAIIFFSSALLWLETKSVEGKMPGSSEGWVGASLLPWLSTQPHSQMTPRITSDYGLFKSGLKTHARLIESGGVNKEEAGVFTERMSGHLIHYALWSEWLWFSGGTKSPRAAREQR